jgi:transcriptional regulator with XRE-family HTH domain
MGQRENELVRFGQLFREIRQKKGWTLEDTEDHGWHDWKYLQKIESGQNITILTFFKLCDLYGIKSEILIKFLKSQGNLK